ncbi:MFS general substrate transporter [Gonapodya prolifera JEL478]|uniref:MFS general substrate transporter n=1 Tax=Gonapodya prolifera (strain JEL478) TaxID=1344416 RepID=A0A139AI59_GONPJ|nr:MFS general substrate transporter [Gonapodya prolifera JEL478]|eukprot:KXS16224.1 MFS general substrate transporter [Gonapodya prolifera JEL478]
METTLEKQSADVAALHRTESEMTVPAIEEAVTGHKSDGEREQAPLPEGGYGWVMVLSTFIAHFWVFGITNSFGIFTDYWTANATFPGVANTVLTFAGTVATSGVDLYNPLTGALAEHFGYNVVAIAGGVFLFLGQYVCTLAGPTDVWVLFGGGTLAGVGYSSCIATAVAIPSHWFEAKLGLALGIGLTGMGVGGAVLTPLIQWLVDTYGWIYAMRSLSIAAGTMLVISGALMRMRYPPRWRTRNKSTEVKRAPTDYSLFKKPTYWKLVLFAITFPPGFLCPYSYIPQQIQDIERATGSTSISGGGCLAIYNAFYALGQILASMSVKKTGPHALLAGSMSFQLLAFVPLYLCSRTSSTLLALTCAVMGFAGSPVGLCITDITIDAFGSDDAATKIGLVFTWFAPSVFASGPILGAIADRFSDFDPRGVRLRTEWAWVIVFCGAAQLVAVAAAVSLWMEKRRKLSSVMWRKG